MPLQCAAVIECRAFIACVFASLLIFTYYYYTMVNKISAVVYNYEHFASFDCLKKANIYKQSICDATVFYLIIGRGPCIYLCTLCNVVKILTVINAFPVLTFIFNGMRVRVILANFSV